MIDSNYVCQVLKGLIEISNEIDVKSVEIDDLDDTIELKLLDNSKIRKFQIEVKEF